jgi:putative peptidoglycan lipid II flippase
MPGEPEAGVSSPPRADSGTRRAVLLAALITVTGIFGSRVLGLVRVQVQSRWFAPSEVGALRAAFDLPDLLFYIVAGGALRSGFVPVFVDLLRRGRADRRELARAWWLFSVLVTTVALVSAALVALGVVFAEPLTAPMTGRWSAQGFSAEATALTIHLTRLLLPAQFFLLVGGVFSGTLDSLRQFTVTALVPCFYNLAIIAGMYFLRASHGVDSAAYGTLAGALLGHGLWQVWALRRHGRSLELRYRPTLAWRDPLVRQVVRVAAPIVLGLCVAEVNLKICGWSVAPFGEAARAWFDNASRVARLPDGIFGAGLGIALFPFLSHLASEGRLAEFRQQTEHILRLALVCATPLAAYLFGCATPCIDLLFGGGKYSEYDVAWTGEMLRWFAVGVVPLTLTLVLTRSFYARQDSVTPLRCGLASVAFCLPANLVLARAMGASGTPLAMSLTCWFNLALLAAAHRRQCGLAQPRALVRAFVVAHGGAWAAASVAAALAARVPGGKLVACTASFAALVAAYLVLMRLWRVAEVADVVRLLRRRATPSGLGGADTEP